MPKSIIVFGGMGMTKMDVSFNGFDFQSDKQERKNSDMKSLHAASYQSLEAKKYNLEDIYILDTGKCSDLYLFKAIILQNFRSDWRVICERS